MNTATTNHFVISHKESAVFVSGYDFNEGIDHHKLLQSFRTSGFQATNFGRAVEEINKMVSDLLRSHGAGAPSADHVLLARHLSKGTVVQNWWCISLVQIACKQQALPEDEESKLNLNPVERKRSNCTIFLGFTSNMISSGVRDSIRFLAQHNLVSCLSQAPCGA